MHQVLKTENKVLFSINHHIFNNKLNLHASICVHAPLKTDSCNSLSMRMKFSFLNLTNMKINTVLPFKT